MHLPRPPQIRHELAEFGFTYGLVIAVVTIAILFYVLGASSHVAFDSPPTEPVGPVF